MYMVSSFEKPKSIINYNMSMIMFVLIKLWANQFLMYFNILNNLNFYSTLI